MPSGVEELERLQCEIAALLSALTDAESTWADYLDGVSPEHRRSAINLVHYWALRQQDLRDLQWRLKAFGLSSLGRSEANVQATLLLVSSAIAAMRGGAWVGPSGAPVVDMGVGEQLLDRNATALLGPAPEDRAARIMVTLPTEAATDIGVVRGLIDAGMRIARINCAHDDATAWTAMAANVRAAANGRPCLVAMDLAGPKLRTGALAPGPKVLRLRPIRDALGQVQTAGRGWLTSAHEPAPPPESGLATLPVDSAWLSRRREGEELQLFDTRGSQRRLLVAAAAPGGFVVTAEKTTYLGTGTVVKVHGVKDRTTIGDLAPTEQSIPLAFGDTLRLTKDCTPAPIDARPPRIGCTLPEVFDGAATGDRILFDDGKLAATVLATAPDHLDVRITQPRDGVVNLKAGKGVNVPGMDLPTSALTEQDLLDLATVAQIADLVQLSFVREPADVVALFGELASLGVPELGVVLKIETPQAFRNLPELLLTAMRHRHVGVMIARGDLAVESGYERMAELQEETLWLCEAAHLPVIWATQVLEQLAKTGQPSRAEITDAAMSERAECVMLNKGPYIVDAVLALDDILGRMAALEYKNSALLRHLQSWRGPPG
jgi:pyruvate kinase